MSNALQVNSSTVVGGLGTQSYTVPSTGAGFYTCSFKSFIPYIAAGSPPVTVVATNEVTDITLVADSAGSLNSTYFTFNSADDLIGFYVWYNINSAGVDPAVAGRTGIAVAGATNANATTLATATRAAILANAQAATYFGVGGATTHVILTSLQAGDETNAANGTASPGFSYSVSPAGSGVVGASELSVVIKQNSTVLLSVGLPSPTQPLLSGSVVISAAAADVISVVLSSLAAADNAPNGVKSIINLFQGIGA